MNISHRVVRACVSALGRRPAVFPGQGAQVVGMGAETAKEVPAAAELYSKASEILGYDLLAIDDKAQLDKTDVSQPAIFVASMAAVEKLRASEGGADTIDAANMAMGLSLGEYTALCFAGAISFEDGVRITKARGEAMQAASEAASSGMVSIIGLDKEKCEEVCKAATEATGNTQSRVPLRPTGLDPCSRTCSSKRHHHHLHDRVI